MARTTNPELDALKTEVYAARRDKPDLKASLLVMHNEGQPEVSAYAYDAQGLITTVTTSSPTLKVTEVVYDAGGQISTLTETFPERMQFLTTLTYDAGGNITGTAVTSKTWDGSAWV